MRVDGFETAQSRLIQKLKLEGSLRSELVETAFRNVPRHHFLPGLAAGQVYDDNAIVTKSLAGTALSSSSQPSLMALMLEQLQLRPGHRVLEIGAGTGYNAALMASIVGPEGSIVTLDIDEDIVSKARDRLARAGFGWVTVECRDGSLGFLERAPFDRIILTIGTPDLAPTWIDQLKPDGVLVAPLSLLPTVQLSVAFTPADGTLHSLSIAPCEFIPIRGALAVESAAESLPLSPDGQLALRVHDSKSLEAEGLLRALTEPARTVAATRMTPRELTAFDFWLRLQSEHWCMLLAGGTWTGSPAIPALFTLGNGQSFTGGLADAMGLCLLARPASPAGPAPPYDPTAGPAELLLKSFGRADGLAAGLLDLLSRWRSLGSPGMQQLHITMLTEGQEPPLSPARRTISGPIHRFALEWAQTSAPR